MKALKNLSFNWKTIMIKLYSIKNFEKRIENEVESRIPQLIFHMKGQIAQLIVCVKNFIPLKSCT